MNSIIINGNTLAEEIKDDIKKDVLKHPSLSLAVLSVGDNSAVIKYINKKKKFGEEVGISVDLINLDSSIDEKDLIEKINYLNNDEKYQGLIVQLPLPSHINTDHVISSIDPKKDVDAMTGKGEVFSPIVSAVDFILKKYEISLADNNILVVGRGRLVGQPISTWLGGLGVKVVSADKETEDLNSLLLSADVIISGAGSPSLIKSKFLKPGVVLIDAGTSEDAGRLAGDADPDCLEKSSLFTPVPGGVGPITVAMLFKNLILLSEKK